MTRPIPDEQAALLAAIVANPDNDTARLVYADWLQENGDEEQATYIRDSIEPGRVRPNFDGENEWLERLGVENVVVDRWNRGFPDRVSVHYGGSFDEDAERLLAFVPIRRLTLFSQSYLHWGPEEWKHEDEDQEGTVPTVPWVERDGYLISHLETLSGLARLTELVLNGFEDLGFVLFESPYFSGLKYLGLPGCGISPRAAKALASNPSLAGLVELDLSNSGLSGNGIGVEGTRAILESPYLRQRLKKLWLAGNSISGEPGGDEVLRRLGEWLGDGLHAHQQD